MSAVSIALANKMSHENYAILSSIKEQYCKSCLDVWVINSHNSEVVVISTCKHWLRLWQVIVVMKPKLTLRVLKPGITRSMPWLLMPWLNVFLGYQQSWFGLFRVNRWLCLTKKNFTYLCHLNVKIWSKIQMHSAVFLKINLGLRNVHTMGKEHGV